MSFVLFAGRVPSLQKGNMNERILSFPWLKENPIVLGKYFILVHLFLSSELKLLLIKKNAAWMFMFNHIKCKQGKFKLVDQSCMCIGYTCLLFTGLKHVKLFAIIGRTKIQRCIPRCWFISCHRALVWCMYNISSHYWSSIILSF